MERIIILIPALNPLPSLIIFVEKLLQLTDKVIVVDDGSDEKYKVIFDRLTLLDNCIVLHHLENKGKGRALKTGFQYVLHHEKTARFVMTAGAHGQHSIADLEHLAESSKVFSDGIVLGVRSFWSKEMPALGYIGNRAASMLFNLLFHKRLLDIQSGLRIIPKQELTWLIHVPGEQFNYDLNMLVAALHRQVPIYEIPIGYARLKKNTLMHYDEVGRTSETLQQIWQTFLKQKKVK